MASNTITANPRRMKARSPPSRALSAESSTPGTVLLRNPMPKYSFELKSRTARKPMGKAVSQAELEVSESKDAKQVADDHNGAEKLVTKQQDSCLKADEKDNVSGAKVNAGLTDARIGTLVNSFPQAVIAPELIKINDEAHLQRQGKTEGKTSVMSDNGALTMADGAQKDRPVIKVDPFSMGTSSKLTHSCSESALREPAPQKSRSSTVSSLAESETGTSSGIVTENQFEPETAGSLTKCKERISQLEEEKQMLKNQLEVQLKVNQELKKLLVASVGEDLQHRVERLTRDRALLCMEVGDYSKKRSEDFEHLDNISIQADMWRSKYLACRVMSDELASAKAFYSMQAQECQVALQQLLNERHELRANLYETHRGLHLVQEAFDPLNSQSKSPHTLTSKHVLDLARTNQHLVDSIKYRLLPGHVTATMANKLEPDWHDYLTQAESHAHELLSREMRPEDFRHLTRSSITAPGVVALERFGPVGRYHPFTNFDNLTINVCCKCKGEISIV